MYLFIVFRCCVCEPQSFFLFSTLHFDRIFVNTTDCNTPSSYECSSCGDHLCSYGHSCWFALLKRFSAIRIILNNGAFAVCAKHNGRAWNSTTSALGMSGSNSAMTLDTSRKFTLAIFAENRVRRPTWWNDIVWIYFLASSFAPKHYERNTIFV